VKNSWREWLDRNSWPLGIIGIMCCFFVADGILLVTVLRDASFGVEDNYYEKSLRYDETRDALARAQQAGWRTQVDIAAAPFPDMPRRVDLRIQDGEGHPVTGLSGTVTAVRPSDVRLRNAGDIVAVPGDDGLYRLLLRVPVDGLWEFELDARKSGQQYRVVVRQDVRLAMTGGPPP
jgi:nitrogen fixation protein FixH